MNFNGSLAVNLYIIIYIHCISIVATTTTTCEYVLHQDKAIQLEPLFDIHSGSKFTCGSLCLSRNDCDAYAFDPVTNKCIAFSGNVVNTMTNFTQTTKYYRKKREGLLEDCLTWHRQGERYNRVYEISPDNNAVFSAYCDMDRGGWTLIQRRVDDSVNFTRGWDEYVNGFGSLYGNFWLGLKYIHLLTSTPVDILLEVVTKDTNEIALMQYSDFYIDGPENDYTMHLNVIGTYNTVATQHGYTFYNGFGYHNGRPFSTFDRPDGCVGNGGGWWFYSCWVVMLNNNFEWMNVETAHPDGYVVRSEMKVRRTL